MLTNAQIALVEARYTALPQPFPTLYHGTNDRVFFARICMRMGFNNEQIFMGTYSMRSLGPTVQYGPGIYLTDDLAGAQGYGALIIEFQVANTTNYLDLNGAAGTAVAAATKIVRWHILSEPRIYALIRVTANYYVLRTPFNVVVSARQ